MTHAIINDYRKTSTTAGQDISVPVTILETPPLGIAAARAYQRTNDGMKVVSEVWARNLPEAVDRRVPTPWTEDRDKDSDSSGPTEEITVLDDDWSTFSGMDCDELRVIAFTLPNLVTGIPKKKAELFEVRVDGGSIDDRKGYIKERLGTVIPVEDYVQPGHMLDVIAITKGKGFQGATKRWGIKLLDHKNSKHRRMVGTLGPWNPHYVHRNVPQSGQVGYHQRTEYNKRVLMVVPRNPKTGEILDTGDDGSSQLQQEVLKASAQKPRTAKREDVDKRHSVAGGFLNYGYIRSSYIVLHGTVPGPTKRLIRLRDPVRNSQSPVEVEVKMVSLRSKQGNRSQVHRKKASSVGVDS